jgi:hypothetical protein
MPIVTLQQRAREIGRLRLGASVMTDRGTRRPTKLEAFRFTSGSQYAIGRVAEVLGGAVQEWKDDGRQQWQVLTPATEIPVMVPPGQAVSQWYELWTGGGCTRRCDGRTEQRTQQPCLCPEDPQERLDAAKAGRACKPTTRINVIIPDLPDVGVWRLESHGYNAAVELAGAVALLDGLQQAGQVIPAVLRVEPREQRYIDPRTDKAETRKFMVPVLEIRNTLRELTQLAARPLADALPPPPPGAAAAIEAAPAPARRRDLDNAQAVAEAAAAAPDKGALLGLWKTAQGNDWMSEWVVVPGDDAMHTLESVLLARGEAIGLSRGAQ